MLKFEPGDFETMKKLENQLSIVLARANDQKVEAALAAFACIRCARTLMNLYPDRTRDMLLKDVILPFLKGEPPPRHAAGNIITLN